jgi:hypothetical protein
VALADPTSWPTPEHTSSTETTRYGTARASAWHRCHPRLEHRGPWRDHPGPLPIIEGTLIRLQVAHLPGDRTPKPLWLWTSDPTVSSVDVDRVWQAFLRRFDLEHTLCATRRLVASPVQSGGTRREVSGSDGLPGAERLFGDKSMPENQRPGPGVRDGALSDPRNMVKA